MLRPRSPTSRRSAPRTGGRRPRSRAAIADCWKTGYLTVPLSDVAEATEAPLAAVDGRWRRPGPRTGRGRRPLAGRCLALQAKAADRYDPAMARLIDNLDLLSKGRTGDLKRICGVDDEDLADMIRELRAYDPKPGCRFMASGAEDVTPDVFVRTLRSGHAVELNQATLPRLLVNRRYYQELKSGPQDRHQKPGSANVSPAPTGWSRRSTSGRGRSSRSSARSSNASKASSSAAWPG